MTGAVATRVIAGVDGLYDVFRGVTGPDIVEAESEVQTYSIVLYL